MLLQKNIYFADDQWSLWNISIAFLVWRYGLDYNGTSSCSVLSDSTTPWNGSLPSSSVLGILQARILEWVVISSSRESSWPQDQTHTSCVSCTDKPILYHWATWEALIIMESLLNSKNLAPKYVSETIIILSMLTLYHYFWCACFIFPAVNSLEQGSHVNHPCLLSPLSIALWLAYARFIINILSIKLVGMLNFAQVLA